MAPPESDPRDVMTRPAPGPDLVLRYADHSDALIDVFLPPALGRPTRPAKLLVLLHGGFWRQKFDRTHLRPLATSLARDGFVVATPEYRRVGGDGGWPATGDDVAAAVAAIPELVEQAAPARIDPIRPMVLAGHSAGGHLALWCGLRAGAARITRIVGLAPVADLAYAARTGMGNNAVHDLLGGAPSDVPERYADADPARMLPGDVSVTVVQGTDDESVPVEANRQLAARFPSIGYVELAGIEHFALIDPLSEAFRTVVRPLFDG